MFRQRLLFVAALAAAIAALPCALSATDENGDKVDPSHIIEVKLGSKDNAMRFFPGQIVLKKGERYALLLTNPSEVTHEFASETFENFITTEKIKVFSAEGDLVAYIVGDVKEVELRPGGVIQWIFTTKAASEHIEIFCDIPGHRDAGMIGEIKIENGN